MNSLLNKNASVLKKGAVRTMFDRAASMHHVINMGIGEPEQNTAWTVCEEAVRALGEGKTHYTANAGILPLREAIAESLREKGVNYDPSTEIIVTNGGTGALVLAFLVTLDPGDEVLIPDPAWLNYPEQVMLCQGRAIRIPCSPEDGFRLRPESIEAVLTERSKILIINSPCNPTGRIMPAEDLQELAVIAEKHDLIIISDEVYDTLYYGSDKPVSFASLPGMKERTITINSMSKGYAMTGWRVGYGAGPALLIDRMTKTQEYFSACVSSVGQWAALYALQHPELAESLREEFSSRRNLLMRELSTIPGILSGPSEGAFYFFPDIRATGLDDTTFCRRLLEESKIVCIPGSSFGDMGKGFIRMSYTADEEKLKEAMTRLREFCTGLQADTEPTTKGV